MHLQEHLKQEETFENKSIWLFISIFALSKIKLSFTVTEAVTVLSKNF